MTDCEDCSRLASIPIVLINLEHRTDRFKGSMEEIASWLGRTSDQDVHVLRPRVFLDDGGFINAAYRSCLDSHLRAAEQALDEGWEEVLILEDDIEYTQGWLAHGTELLKSLDDEKWDIANLGYLDPKSWLKDNLETGRAAPYWVEYSDDLIGAQAYILKGSVLPRWIAHLTKISTGEVGDHVAGPMGPDGAMVTIARADSSVRRIIPIPNLVAQRSSLSDINDKRFDNRKCLTAVISLGRRAKRKLKGRVKS